MSGIIKKTDIESGKVEKPEIDIWGKDQYIVPITKNNKVLKAKDFSISKSNKGIPEMETLLKETNIIPLMQNGQIQGLKIACRCGEEIIVNFEYDIT